MNGKLLKKVLEFSVRVALNEDLGSGDVTARATVPGERQARAIITAKEAGVIAGLSVAREVFIRLDKRIKVISRVREGARVSRGKVIATLSGPARAILSGERTALNYLQHLSGIATLTAQYVQRVRGSKGQGSRVKVLDTRKTAPGLRLLEKDAVRLGGGVNHRLGLYDAVLIKDNHIKLAGGIGEAIFRAKAAGWRGARIEVEAKSLAEVRIAAQQKVGRILLDNMDLPTLKKAVALCRRAGVRTEASGGINLQNIASVARTGVDFISVGALTHSAPALDINLKVI